MKLMKLSKEEFDTMQDKMLLQFGEPSENMEGYIEFLMIQAVRTAIETLGPNWVRTAIEKEFENVQ